MAGELFPRRVVSLDPPGTGGNTISKPFFGELDDGLSYCIKHDGEGWPVRASEYLCTELCSIIGIAVPPYTLAEMADRTINFASQIIHDQSSNDTWLLSLLPINQGTVQFSKIFAFDLFSCNDDRHDGNFLVRSQNNKDRVFAMDFSHAFFAKWRDWPVPPLLPTWPSMNTIDTGRQIRAAYGFDVGAAVRCLMDLSKVDCARIRLIMSQMPAGWLSPGMSKELINWWCDGSKTARIRGLVKGLKDGSLL